MIGTGSFKESLSLKLLSLVLSGLLWFTLTPGRDDVKRISVPVAVMNTPPHLQVAGTPPPVIELEVSGPRIAMMRLGSERLSAVLDLAGACEGTVSFTHLDSTVHLRSGLRVVRVQPAAIELKLVKAGN